MKIQEWLRQNDLELMNLGHGHNEQSWPVHRAHLDRLDAEYEIVRKNLAQISDDMVERAAKAIQEEDRPKGWDGLNDDQRAANDQARMPGYRILARAALKAVQES